MSQTLRPNRTISVTAVAIFLVVYVAALVLVLGPKDLFLATPGSQTEAGQ